MQQTYQVMIDNCVVGRFAELGIDPVNDLSETEFTLAFTPDLKLEYENALGSSSIQTSQQAIDLINRLLQEGSLVGFFGFDGGPCLGFDQGTWASQEQSEIVATANVIRNKRGLPRKRTDVHLVALAQDAIVITANDKEGLWRRAPAGRGHVIQWNDFKATLAQERNLASALRKFLADDSAVGQ